MKECGFDIIHSELLKNQMKTNHNLYEFEDDSAISVYMSDNGAIMMEIVQVEEEKNAHKMTEQETNQMVEQMKGFCEKYPIIKEKLEQRGIKFVNEQKMLPDKCFAKQVAVPNGKFSRIKDKESLVEKLRRKDSGKLYKNM